MDLIYGPDKGNRPVAPGGRHNGGGEPMESLNAFPVCSRKNQSLEWHVTLIVGYFYSLPDTGDAIESPCEIEKKTVGRSVLFPFAVKVLGLENPVQEQQVIFHLLFQINI